MLPRRSFVNSDQQGSRYRSAASRCLNGKTLTVKSAKIGNTNLKRGTYAGGSTVAIGDGSLGDYLVDSATGGSLVVNSYGPILLIIPR